MTESRVSSALTPTRTQRARTHARTSTPTSARARAHTHTHTHTHTCCARLQSPLPPLGSRLARTHPSAPPAQTAAPALDTPATRPPPRQQDRLGGAHTHTHTHTPRRESHAALAGGCRQSPAAARPASTERRVYVRRRGAACLGPSAIRGVDLLRLRQLHRRVKVRQRQLPPPHPPPTHPPTPQRPFPVASAQAGHRHRQPVPQLAHLRLTRYPAATATPARSARDAQHP